MENFKKYLAEMFGTMFLVLLAGPSIGGLGIGLCFGLVLVCLCYAIGNISGCHVNPRRAALADHFFAFAERGVTAGQTKAVNYD